MVVTADLVLIPNRDDIASSLVAVGSAMAFKGQGEPWNAGLEQIVAIIVGRNIAARIESSDRTDPAGSTVQEYDMYTGILRAGWSAYKSRGNQRIAMDGAKGVLCNILGREVVKSFFPKTVPLV